MIAEAVASVALELNADAVHGCTGKGNDQLRFEIALRASYPGVRVIAPLRDRIWTREEIAYALERGIPVAQTVASPYSIDESPGPLDRGGDLEDLDRAARDPFELTAHPDDAPAPSEIVIGFADGLPVALDGEELDLVDLVAELNERAGAYGIGRIDMIENRAVGIKSREVYEAPAALVLIEAHRALEDLILTRAELQEKRRLEDRWATLVYEGHWFSPLRTAIDAFVDATQELVEGKFASSCALPPPWSRAGARRRRSTQSGSRPTGRGDLPARGRRRVRPDRALEAELAAVRERGGGSVTLWAARVETDLAPEVAGFLRADDGELLPYDCEATIVHGRRLHAAGLLTDSELREVEARLSDP